MDYRKLDAITVDTSQNLPTIHEIIKDLVTAKVFDSSTCAVVIGNFAHSGEQIPHCIYNSRWGSLPM